MNSKEIKKFVDVIEEIENRKDITAPVLNVDKNAKPSMLGKYFRSIEEELDQKRKEKKATAGLLAERIANKLNKKIAATVEATAPAAPKPQNTQSWKLSQKTGSGAHRDKKREEKSGQRKHKTPYTEDTNPADDAPPIDSKENFLNHLQKNMPGEDISSMVNYIATDPDGTVDVEETMLLMMEKMMNVMPEILEVFEGLANEIKNAKANPEIWSKYTPEEQQSMDEALAEFNKTLPIAKAEMEKSNQAFQQKLPAARAAVANKQNQRYKQQTGTNMVRGEFGQKTNIGTQDYSQPASESVNPADVVKTDVPLLIRLLEYAREDAKTDMDLHNVADNLIELSKTGQTLTMQHYNQIVNDQELSTEDISEQRVKHTNPEKIKRRIMAMAHLMDDDFGGDPDTAVTIAEIYKLDKDDVQDILSGQGEVN